MIKLCDDARLQELIDAAGTCDGLPGQFEELLTAFPEDPRLYFLKGSILAGDGQLIEAHQALTRAVEIAPDYEIARFQLGFFQLTSGESNNALKTWARLDMLPDSHYLKFFVIGLRHLIRDEFPECIQSLEDGIAANEETLPLNDDMRLLIKECEGLMSEASDVAADTDDMSATSALLNQFKN